MINAIRKFVPKFLLNIYHFKLALLGAFLCGFPGKSKNVKIIGVTGTSGKSTTVDFIARVLEESGRKTASLSSIRFKIGEKEWENRYKMTMPGRFAIQKFLKQAKKASCEYAVLEVTSEGIRQHRHRFIDFQTAVFTNLSPEHIESHGGFENYRKEKLKLFRATKNRHIINIDDDNAEYFANIDSEENIFYGITNKSKFQNFIAENIESSADGVSFSIANVEFNLNLLGKFNVYNALAAICAGKSCGVDLETCKKALEKIKAIPGRMEIIVRNPFVVIVDYAHTPEQLENVYKTFSNSKLICVLGSCGGGRDKWKRPVLGKIASRYCKEIIITNEDPYDENPLSIMSEIESGFSSNPKYEKILDRKKAIETAIKSAKTNDVVIITGKGAEPWMCVKNGEKIPWDDRKIAREALGKLTELSKDV